jgi:cyclophilin family peptidyl-prolyl cis-trans isomerase/HEAT repeat protein
MNHTRAIHRSLLAAALFAGGCASAPPPPIKPPSIPFEQKMSWMLQLEDRRVLRAETPPPPAPPVTPAKGRKVAAVPPPTPPPADLTNLLTDTEPRVRRRAALAIGRVGLPAGIQPLVGTLSDADPEVREMAAFALGLIGDVTAAPALTGLLSDASPLVRGRAAEALGQIDAKEKDQVHAEARREVGDAIGRMVAEYAKTPAVTSMQGDDEKWPAAPEAEAFRLGVYALVRLGTYEPLASAVLGPDGRPTTTWWPVAYAFGRIGDPRAQPVLAQLLKAPGKYSPAFAARGLGAIKDGTSVDALGALMGGASTSPEVVVSAIRALAAIGDRKVAAPIAKLVLETTDPNIKLEGARALGALRAPEGLTVVQDLLTDPWPTLRAEALRSAAAIDQDAFLLVLSGMDPDPQWVVRAALVDVLAGFPPEIALERVRSMLHDEDRRVIPSVLRALRRLKAPDAAAVALAQLKEPDFAVRSAAAEAIGALKPPEGLDALAAALALAQGDAAIDARASILSAMAEYGGPRAIDAVKRALEDKDWAVRVHAVTLLTKLDAAGDYRDAIRPAPGAPIAPYADPQLIAPAYLPHVFIETPKGTIEFELTVLDAPQTSRNFTTLARKGFFNGLQIHRVVPNFVVQDGDPRGDGDGGPGYTIRDELNERPFLRGTVGMALSWRDTGGSQFFITHSPQPHLDARYTVFGLVVNGMDVVDRIQQGDTITRVRVWDGTAMQ